MKNIKTNSKHKKNYNSISLILKYHCVCKSLSNTINSTFSYVIVIINVKSSNYIIHLIISKLNNHCIMAYSISSMYHSEQHAVIHPRECEKGRFSGVLNQKSSLYDRLEGVSSCTPPIARVQNVCRLTGKTHTSHTASITVARSDLGYT